MEHITVSKYLRTLHWILAVIEPEQTQVQQIRPLLVSEFSFSHLTSKGDNERQGVRENVFMQAKELFPRMHPHMGRLYSSFSLNVYLCGFSISSIYQKRKCHWRKKKGQDAFINQNMFWININLAMPFTWSMLICRVL